MPDRTDNLWGEIRPGAGVPVSTGTSAKLRIVIADDHSILSEGLRILLSKDPQMEVSALVDSGEAAVAAVESLQPDIVLMDLSMPGMGGLQAIQEIRKRPVMVKILVLTAHRTEEYIHAALQAGADGYILKDSPHADLLTAIRSIANGKVYISPEISGFVVSGYLNATRRPVTRSIAEMLTKREMQILRLVASGKRNRQIAEDLAISIKTVEKHRSSLMRKLDMDNVAELTAFARENHIIE